MKKVLDFVFFWCKTLSSREFATETTQPAHCERVFYCQNQGTVMATPKKPSAPRGRPTIYKVEYCAKIVEVMAQGYSATGFAGQIGVSRECISEWARVHTEFSVALKAGKAACGAHWEKMAIKTGMNGGGPGTATIITFALKNMARHDWADRQSLELSGPDGGPVNNTLRVEFVDATKAD